MFRRASASLCFFLLARCQEKEELVRGMRISLWMRFEDTEPLRFLADARNDNCRFQTKHMNQIRQHSIFLHALTYWPIMAVGGVVNGIFRELILTLIMPPRMVQVTSGLLLMVIVVLVESVFVKQHLSRLSRVMAWQIGILWLALTVGFEFGFGHVVMGHSWEHLVSNYNIRTGNLWSLVLVVMFVAPIILYQRSRSHS
jgi:hypothetical protein